MKNQITGLIFAIVTSTVMTACATAYQSNGLTGGYSDFRVTQNSFVVSFNGNGFTSQEKVLKYCLRRAAELTIQNGYTYFIVTGNKDTTSKEMFSNLHSGTNGNIYNYSNSTSYNSNTNAFAITSEVNKPGLSITIKCFTEKPSEEAINAKEYLYFNTNQ